MLSRGFKLDDIVVLSPLRDGACVRGILLLPEWQSRIAEYPKPHVVRFTTIHAFKGLEAKAVILTDISCKSYNGEANILYVGMSRALHCLTVLVAESFRPEFQAALHTYAASQK
jgi:ATP-dependent exoDNAse (exonuclease V) beta subunit